MEYSLRGFNNKVATFKCSNVIPVGVPVCISSTGEIVKCNDGNDFIGISISSKEEVVSVMLEGYIEVPYSGTVPSYGYANVVAGAGGIKVKVSNSDACKKRLITKVDSHQQIIGFIL